VDIPILKQGQVVIATIRGSPTDAELLQLRAALIQQVVRLRSTGVVLDVAALDVMDSFATRTLRDLAQIKQAFVTSLQGIYHPRADYAPSLVKA
jgi:rsbT antagonist protein RsbS